MVTITPEKIGHGIYTPAEAAFYARVSTNLINRWLFGTRNSQGVLSPEFGIDDRAVSFLDFVQALAIRNVRQKYGISLQKIREAIEVAEEEYNVNFPFARKHCTFRFGKEIVIVIPPCDAEIEQSNKSTVFVTGRQKNQHLMHPIIEQYLSNLSFDPEGLAAKYDAFNSVDGQRIVMDPERMFGEPIVESCRHTARTLWEACKIEGGFESAAKAYGVSVLQVKAAWEYYDYLLIG